MNAVVIYKTKYGSAKTYAQWIANELSCIAVDAKTLKPQDLEEYDVIIYGGGLYAEVINGITLITKNIQNLSDKKIVIFTLGITPVDCRNYYDNYVIEKNFPKGVPENVKIYNFPGKMVLKKLSPVHLAALKGLKKLMQNKKNPTEMEKMLIELCDADGDFCDKSLITSLVDYVKNEEK